QLHAQIEADPALQEPLSGEGRLSYVERPGDGSEVRWQTWISGDQQLSVGCHTRRAASPEQREICELAQQSFRIELPTEESGEVPGAGNLTGLSEV
ncbi:MAG TPA: type VII secretion-associated protein, partial [Corynebacterium sp.]|nr:type VII secretion-associated protein [Corynebacterium sp.]